MNRKIAALTVAAAVLLIGACSKTEDTATTDSSVPVETSPVTTYAPQDLKLVDIPVSKPAPGVKVEASTLPEELVSFTAVPGLTPDQQNCINGAIKQTVDADASVAKTPGKVATVGGKAVAICDGGPLFTDQLIDGLSTGAINGTFKMTPDQIACLKKAFAADKDGTAKVIGSSMIAGQAGDLNMLKDALAAFDTKCGVKVSEAMNVPPS